MSSHQSESRVGCAKRLRVEGVTRKLLVSSTMTDGQHCIFEVQAAPTAGVDRHIHRLEDETLIVIAGCWLVDVGSALRAARCGDVVKLPRGIPHEFRNVSTNTGKLLCIYSPGGIETLFTDDCFCEEPERYGIAYVSNRLPDRCFRRRCTTRPVIGSRSAAAINSTSTRQFGPSRELPS